MPGAVDTRVRSAAFAWLEQQADLHGDVLTRESLARGFELDGERVPLAGPQGIFKPRLCELPISITTIPDGPYSDGYSNDGLLIYRYRGTDPHHHENVGLRSAMVERVPLVYLYRVVRGKYLVVWPVFIVADDPGRLSFTVEVDYKEVLAEAGKSNHLEDPAPSELRRRYITTTVRHRIHQSAFRERVIRAYKEQCALCRLRHHELLDAAHIVPDADPDGVPAVPNGLSLCKLHHAAFDRLFIGIRPDYTIVVRTDLLNETDGPMLRHGLQGMHGQQIFVPRRTSDRPDPELLERRFEQFQVRR